VITHLCRHQLEQLVANDLRATVHPALRVHLAACDPCSMRKRALEAARARFLAAYPAADFARAVVEQAAQPEPPPRRRWQGWSAPGVLASAAGSLAIGAAALLWFSRAPAPPAIRLKGGVSLQAFAKHAGRTSALRDGDALAPGDQLAFEYALDRPRYLLLLGIDDAGAITRYFPADSSGAAPLAATPRAQLPVGIELDARKGQERLYALFSAAALDEAEARGALIQALFAAHAHGAAIAALRELDLPAHQVTIWFRKP
jgi:hypothetical protein